MARSMPRSSAIEFPYAVVPKDTSSSLTLHWSMPALPMTSRPWRRRRGNFSDNSRYDTLGTFLRADAKVLDLGPGGEIRLSGGVRLSHFRASAPNVPDLGDVKYDFTGVVGSAGLQYLLPGQLNVYGTFVQGFRAPNLQETTVLADTGSKFEIPNPNLRPERSDTVEFGARGRLGPVGLELAGFYSRLDDVIDEEAATFNGAMDVDGKPVIRRVNANGGEYIGVEGGAQVSLDPVTVRLSASWIRGDIHLANGSTIPARRVPPFSGTGAVRYHFLGDRAFAETALSFAARQSRLHPSDESDLRICETSLHSGTLDMNCNGTPGWVRLDLRGGFQLNRNWGFALAVENATDTAYRLHGSGFPAPGVDARATVTARW